MERSAMTEGLSNGYIIILAEALLYCKMPIIALFVFVNLCAFVREKEHFQTVLSIIRSLERTQAVEIDTSLVDM